MTPVQAALSRSDDSRTSSNGFAAQCLSRRQPQRARATGACTVVCQRSDLPPSPRLIGGFIECFATGASTLRMGEGLTPRSKRSNNANRNLPQGAVLVADGAGGRVQFRRGGVKLSPRLEGSTRATRGRQANHWAELGQSNTSCQKIRVKGTKILGCMWASDQFIVVNQSPSNSIGSP